MFTTAGGHKAIVLFSLGIFCFSTMEATVKSLPAGYTIWTILFFRYAIGSLVVIPFAIPQLRYFNRSTLKFGITRGMLALLSAGCYLSAVRLIPLAQASTLIFSSPLFSIMLSHYLLQERLNKSSFIALALGTLGVACLFYSAYTPSADLGTGLVGMSLAICSAVIFSLMLIVSKRQAMSTNSNREILGLMVQSLAAMTVIIVLGLNLPSSMDGMTCAKLFGVGALGSVGLLLVTSSFKERKLGHVSMYQFTGVAWATIYGYFLFGEIPTTFQLLGLLMILFALLSLELTRPVLKTKSVLTQRNN